MAKIIDIMQSIIEKDAARDTKFAAMDTMFYNTSTMPSQFEDDDHFRWSPTTTPSDAVWGASRVLSAIQPRVTFFPLANNPLDKLFAAKVENIVKYQYEIAGKRAKSKLTRQITLNSILYDMVAVQTTFLPWQAENIDIMGGNEKRIKSSQRFGQFAFTAQNPKNVHAVHSGWGLEVVVFEQVFNARDALGFWGDKMDKKIAEKIRAGDTDWLYIVDYMDDTDRCVKAWDLGQSETVPRKLNTIEGEKGSFDIIEKQPHKLPFIPWAIKGGGSTTETDPALHFRPMLDSVYKSGQFDTLNIMRSLQLSKAIKKHAKAATVTTTFDGETPEMDYDDPTENVPLKMGESMTSLPPDQLDPSLFTLIGGQEDAMAASTVSRILLGEVPAQIAFATMNLGQQSAARSIVPYRETSEEAIAEVMSQQLLWSSFTKENLHAWGTSKDTRGERFELQWNEIDPNHVMFNVELVADVPTDNMSQTNVGRMHLEMGVSHEQVFEQIGYTDPESILEARAQEDMDRAEVDLHLQKQALEMEAAIQIQAQQIVQQAQQQAELQAQQLAEQQAQPQDGLDGNEFNTAEGGTPPAVANTGLLREEASGVDRQGTPVG